MKRLSLQWRITLMTALLICLTCVLINCLVGYSGMLHMDSIGAEVSAHGEVEAASSSSFDPTSKDLDDELTIVVSNAQESFGATSWYITAAVTLLGGVLAYFVSGLRCGRCAPLRRKSRACSPTTSPTQRSAKTYLPNSGAAARRLTT